MLQGLLSKFLPLSPSHSPPPALPPPRRRRLTTTQLPPSFISTIHQLTTTTNNNNNNINFQLPLNLHSDAFTPLPPSVALREALLRLWAHILTHPKCLNTHTRYDSLLRILTRYEFDLIHTQPPHILTEYRRLCIETVKLALRQRHSCHRHRGRRQRRRRRHRRFAAQVLAIAFFRLPEMNGDLLDTLIASNQPEMNGDLLDTLIASNQPPQQSHVLLDRFDQLMEKQRLSDRAAVSASTYFLHHNPSLFVWSECHQPVLPSLPPFTSVFEHRQDFFEFVRAYLTHIVDTAHGDIQWSLVPGYDALMRCFVASVVFPDDDCSIHSDTTSVHSADSGGSGGSGGDGSEDEDSIASDEQQQQQQQQQQQLQQSEPRDIKPRHAATVLSCMSMAIENTALLPLMVSLLLRTTSVHDLPTVNQTLDVLHNWWQQSPLLFKTLVDYDEMTTALTILLDSLHFQVLIKTLWFVYTHINQMPLAVRLRLLEHYLLDGNRYFPKFFAHWCPEVRRIFHYILVYKLRRRGNHNNNNNNQTTTTTSSSYSLLRLLQPASSVSLLRADDPKLDACVEEICDEVDTDDDERLLQLTDALVTAARQEATNVYSRQSYDEYEACRGSYQRLQAYTTRGGTLTPELFFDIVLTPAALDEY